MSDVDHLIENTTSEAIARMQIEVTRLRDAIEQARREYEQTVEPLQAELAKAETWIATLQRPLQDRPSDTPSGRARRGSNRRAILTVLTEQPGMTSAEVADATGIAKNVVNSTLHKLAKDGEVRKDQTDRGVEHRLV